MPALKINFVKLQEEFPPGTLVAFSSDQQKMICTGGDFADVYEDARRLGEPDPLVICVPEPVFLYTRLLFHISSDPAS